MTGCSTTPTHSTPCRWAGTHPKSRTLMIYLVLQTHGMRGSRAATTTPSPVRVDAHRQTRATRPSAPQRRRRHLHRHPRERHVLRPHVRPRVRAGGRDVVHRPGADGGCVHPGRHHQGRAQGGGGRVRRRSVCRVTMPHWDVSQVTDMSFLFQGKTQFNVDISQWEMSQVTDAQGMFHGRLQLPTRTSGDGPWRPRRDTTGMFTGADTWLSRISSGWFDTTDGPPAAWVVIRACRTSASNRDGALHCGGWRTTPREMIRARCRHQMRRFPDRAALKTAVDNCLAVDATGVACCSHGADCGAAGTVEMPDWDVSLVTSMSELFKTKGPSTRIYRDGIPRASRHVRCSEPSVQQISSWDTSSVTTCECSARVQPGYRYMGYLERHDHADMFLRPSRSTSTYRDGTSARSRPCRNVLRRHAFNTMPVGWDTSKVTDSDEYFILQTHGMRGSRAAPTTPSPVAGGRASTDACDASFRPSTAPSATAPTPS